MSAHLYCAIAGGSVNGHPVLRFQHLAGASYNQPQYIQAYGELANGYILHCLLSPTAEGD